MPRLHQRNLLRAASCLLPATSCVLRVTCCFKQQVAHNKQQVARNLLRATCCAGVNAALGIHLESNFSWQPHIEAILAKATQRLYFLKQLTPDGVPHSQLRHFYLTVIRPVLEYASPVWHHLITKKQSDQTEAIHLPFRTRHAVYKCHLPS